MGLLSRLRVTIVFVTTLLGVLISAAILLRAPEYQSTALLVIDRTGSDFRELKGHSEREVDTQVEMLNAMSIVKLLAVRLESDAAKVENVPRRAGIDAGAGEETQQHQQEPSQLPRGGIESWRGVIDSWLRTVWRTVDNGTARGRAESDAGPLFNHASVDLLALQRKFRIRRRGLTDVISIEAKAETPERAAHLANLYAEVYLAEQVRTQLSAIQGVEDALARRIEAMKTELSQTAPNFKLRTTLRDYLDRLAKVRQHRSSIMPELRLAAPALSVRMVAFPSRRLLLLFGWATALGLAIGLAIYRDGRRVAKQAAVRERTLHDGPVFSQREN
jgi:uncharacterized protein involved in exopolysaccharide biosynthesis